MSVIQYDKVNGSAKTTQQSGGGTSGGGVTMNEVAENFLPATPTSSTQDKYNVEVEARFKDGITLYDSEGNEVTLSIVDGHIYINGAVVAKEDVVAYGVEDSEVQTVEELLAQLIVANPTGTSTATITKIKINGVIYSIQGGGGSGGGIIWGGISGSGNAVTSMNYDSESNTLSATKGTTFAVSGSVVNTIQGEIGSNFADVSAFQTWCSEHQDYVGSCRIGGVWYHIASYRHRNNSGDGNKYGWYLRKPLSVSTNSELILGYQSNGTWFAERTIAGTDSNVSSANKLASAINLWGQSFDGSGNVGGDMTGVGNITPTDGSNLGSASARFRAFLSQLELYGATPYLDFHFGNSTADYTSRIIETASGVLNILANVGIGVASPSKKLDVNGGIRARGASQMDGLDLNNQALTKVKSIALVSPDGTKTRTLTVDNSGNLRIDGAVIADGDVVTYNQ